MRYVINFDKTVNQLIPHYLGGRKLVLLLQSLVKPLQTINDAWVGYAKEVRIEAAMTSQIFKIEWYLNRKFSKYFKNGGMIFIKNRTVSGVGLYHEDEPIDQNRHMLLKHETDGASGTVLRYAGEKLETNSYSFTVYSPEINTRLISQEKYLAMLSYYIDKYRLGGKTYQIKFNK